MSPFTNRSTGLKRVSCGSMNGKSVVLDPPMVFWRPRWVVHPVLEGCCSVTDPSTVHGWPCKVAGWLRPCTMVLGSFVHTSLSVLSLVLLRSVLQGTWPRASRSERRSCQQPRKRRNQSGSRRHGRHASVGSHRGSATGKERTVGRQNDRHVTSLRELGLCKQWGHPGLVLYSTT